MLLAGTTLAAASALGLAMSSDAAAMNSSLVSAGSEAFI